jgi:beta-glucosidase-like glycosyl hydrolase
MSDIARLIMPAVRADDDSSWPPARALAAGGAGGFLIFGGERETLPLELARLREAAGGRPLLFASDLERGAGQQFRGLTRLPHLMAIGATGDVSLAERAGEVTAREARAAGIHLVFAPCVDLNTDPANPIINIRAFGDDPARAAELGAAWVRGARRGGALACAKHYPGHGHTSVDSHVALPRLDADLETLEARELVPFRRLAAEDVAAVMTAHMAVPALTGDATRPVTLSRRAIDYLRGPLGFAGLVVTDALLMGGITGAFDEAEAAVLALEAGCDILLCPADPQAVAERVGAAVAAGRVPRERVAAALARLDHALDLARAREAPEASPAEPDPEGAGLAETIAARALACLGGAPAPALADADPALLVILSGDPGEAGGHLAAELHRLAPRARILAVGPDSPDGRLAAAALEAAEAAGRGGQVVVAVFSKILAWKGAAGLAPREARLLARIAAEAAAGVVSLGSPYLLRGLPGREGPAEDRSGGRRAGGGGAFRACAFSDEPPSQRAVAAAIARGGPWPGRFPVAP